ncbi:MAG TPA: chemotaxis protein CheA [Anaeromyxobacteraceae bacterium]|nr:chemotaxis protein CheA [Anaeromyxobacteraceae bacterium]
MDEHEIQIDREALIRVFAAEAAENLGAMEQGLVALESRPDDAELVHELFRAAHTLKGSASLVGFDAVRDLAHELEALLEQVRRKALQPGPALVTLLLGSVDVLRAAVAEASAGRTEATPAVEAWRARIRRAAERGAAAEAASAPAAVGTAAPAGPRRTLRVDVWKLDRMLDLAGEIAIARGRFADMLERRQSLTVDQILEAHREADRLHLDLQDLVMKARMVAVGPAFQQQLRTVRDIAAAQGKQARLVLEGEDVEVDTAVVEHIRDPLTHMVRNALDHGIERPEVRRERGKDPVGCVTLRAFHEGSSLVVEVEDDGAGFDGQRIAARAAALGLVADAAQVGEEEVRRLVFAPGLSTSETVTEISGRGVGMDVVRRNVEALRGSVSVESHPGRGTRISIRLPLTLSIVQGFHVAVGDDTYILPLDAVVECLDLPPQERAAGEADGVLNLRGRPVPFLRLGRRLGLGGARAARESVVVVRDGPSVAGLAVDALLGESQTVVKPLSRLFRSVPGVSGSAVLGSGRVALILDVPALLREALQPSRNAAGQASPPAGGASA